MADEKKLMELLRRAHPVLGEALASNARDESESAETLHNEIGGLFGLDPVKRDDVRCEATWFASGGREERRCRETAVTVCVGCGNARCDEHDDMYFEERDGKMLCEECLPDNATQD